MYCELWIVRRCGRIFSSSASAAARSSADSLFGSLPRYSSAVATMSVGSSSTATPQPANFATIAGSNTSFQLSTGASGMTCRTLAAS